MRKIIRYIMLNVIMAVLMISSIPCLNVYAMQEDSGLIEKWKFSREFAKVESTEIINYPSNFGKDKYKLDGLQILVKYEDGCQEVVTNEDSRVFIVRSNDKNKQIKESILNLDDQEQSISSCVITSIEICNKGKKGISLQIPEFHDFKVDRKMFLQYMNKVAVLQDYRKGYGMEYYILETDNGGSLQIDYDTDIKAIDRLCYSNRNWK